MPFTISIAVNGLQDFSLRTCLMIKGKIKWVALASKLGAWKSAKESEAIIVQSRNQTSVKQAPTASADMYRVSKMIKVRIREVIELPTGLAGDLGHLKTKVR